MRDDGQDLRPAAAGPADDGSWLHGTWVVTALDGTPPDGAQGAPWLVLEGDGVVYGYAGVNRVRGTWHLDREVLGFGPVVATRMAGPEASSVTERAVLGFLAAGGRVVPDVDRRVVRGADGRTVELARTDRPPDGTA